MGGGMSALLPLAPEDILKAETRYMDLSNQGVAGTQLTEQMGAYIEELKAKADTAGGGPRSPRKPRQIMAEPNPLVCTKILGMVTNHAHHAWVVGTDGSEGASDAMATVLGLMKAKDTLEVLHICDTSKQDPDLQAKYKPESIRLAVESELTGTLPKKRWKLSWIDKFNKGSTSEVIADHVNSSAQSASAAISRQAPSFYVSGFVGRKGPKEDPTIAGTAAQLAAQKMDVPVIIAKQSVPVDATAPRTWVAAVKHVSDHTAYEIAVALMKPKDTLHVLWMYEEDLRADHDIAAIKSEYEASMRADGFDAALVARPLKPAPMHEQICAYVDEVSAQFLVIIPRYENKVLLKTTTEHLISSVKCNLVLCKQGPNKKPLEGIKEKRLEEWAAS